MRMFDPLSPIIGCRCRSKSATIGGLGTLRYMAISVDWATVRIEMDSAHVVCASLFSLERLRAAGVEAW